MKTFLHVGGESKRKDLTTIGFNTSEWNDKRLDIDDKVEPVIIGAMTNMSVVVDASVDQNQLTELAYTSVAGPITPLYILYGHRPPMARGNLYMAHRCGFTQNVLTGTLQVAGFAIVATKLRDDPYSDLWALSTVKPIGKNKLRPLVLEYFPK